MKAVVKSILFLTFGLAMMNCYGMQEWIRTNLENLGLSQPKLGPTQELQQIIEREGTFKNTGLKRTK